jgi:hypothetical protein
MSAARNGNNMNGNNMRGFKSSKELKQAIMSHLSYTSDPEKLKTKNFDYVYEIIKMNKPLYSQLNNRDRLDIEYALGRIDTDLYRWLLQYPNKADRQIFQKQLNITDAVRAMLKAERLRAYDMASVEDEMCMMYTGSPMPMMPMGSDMEM